MTGAVLYGLIGLLTALAIGGVAQVVVGEALACARLDLDGVVFGDPPRLTPARAPHADRHGAHRFMPTAAPGKMNV